MGANRSALPEAECKVRWSDIETDPSLAFSPHDRSILATTRLGDVLLRDVGNGSVRSRIQAVSSADPWVRLVAFSPHDADILATSWADWGSDSPVQLWNIGSGALCKRLQGHSGKVWSLAFSPHSADVLAGAAAFARQGIPCGVLLWSVSSGTLQSRLVADGGRDVYSVAFSPRDADLLAGGGADHLVCLWSVGSGTLRSRLRGHAGNVRSVAFSPHDADLLASGADNDQVVLVWNVGSGTLRSRLRGHAEKTVRSVAFSPHDVDLLASGGGNEVLLWSISSGTVRSRLDAGEGGVVSVAFSPHDVNTLASVTGPVHVPGELKLWGSAALNVVMSVRFDVTSFSPYAAHITEFLRKRYGIRVYNPNNFNKRHCGRECSIHSYGCTAHPFVAGQRPTDNDCWQSSYRWHLSEHETWGFAGGRCLMLAVVEDQQLGPGQQTEKKLAESMGIERLEVHVKKLQIGELGSAELDRALLTVAWLLKDQGLL